MNIVEFDSERAARYLERVFRGYEADPAETDYQQGYLAAMLDIYREGLSRGKQDDRLKLLDAQVRAPGK